MADPHRAARDWGAEYDVQARPGTLTEALASSRRPNSAEPHDSDVHIERATRAAGIVIGGLVRAAAKLATRPAD